jgi:hypothetical protein
MGLFSGMFNCLYFSSQVGDDDDEQMKKKKKNRSEQKAISAKAPIVLSYFPINSNLSRL